MNTYNYYQTLIKPSFAPPAWLFGPVWSILYLVIIGTFGYVAYRCLKEKKDYKILLPLGLNVIFNLAFTPIQFWLQNNLLASVDIFLVLVTLLWLLALLWKKYRWPALLNIPYLLWVLFATVLQFTVTYLNK